MERNVSCEPVNVADMLRPFVSAMTIYAVGFADSTSAEAVILRNPHNRVASFRHLHAL